MRDRRLDADVEPWWARPENERLRIEEIVHGLGRAKHEEWRVPRWSKTQRCTVFDSIDEMDEGAQKERQVVRLRRAIRRFVGPWPSKGKRSMVWVR